MSQAQFGDHNPPRSLRGHVTHDRALLLASVEAVRLARCCVHLEHTVAIDVPDFDLVDEGLRRAVDLLHVEPAARGWAKHRNHPLIVGSDGQDVVPVAVEICDLDIAHATGAAAEILPPRMGRDQHAVPVFPDLHGGLAAGYREKAWFPGRPGEAHGLVKHVARRVLDRHDLPVPGIRWDEKLESRRQRDRPLPWLHLRETGESQHQGLLRPRARRRRLARTGRCRGRWGWGLAPAREEHAGGQDRQEVPPESRARRRTVGVF